jgi:hypothetical protein
MEAVLRRWSSEGLGITALLSSVLVAIALALVFDGFLSAQNESARPFPDGLVRGMSPSLWLRNSSVCSSNGKDDNPKEVQKEEVRCIWRP